MAEAWVDVSENVRTGAIVAEVRRIETLGLTELREIWSTRWGLPPRFRSVELLRRLITWRLQAAHFGGLDADTKAMLRRSSMPQPPGPPPGSRLTREFRGVLHHVDVVEQGFIYQGRTFDNLSAVAPRRRRPSS